MNYIEELRELTPDEPAPPLRDSATALSLAKRSTRRRNGLTTAAGAFVVVAALAIAVPVLRGAGPAERAPNHPASPVNMAGAQAPLPVPPPPAPTYQQALAHAEPIVALLRAAAPAGYTATPAITFTNGGHSGTWLIAGHADGTGAYGQVDRVLISKGTKEGTLEAVLTRDAGAVPAGDLCSAEATARVAYLFGAGSNCQVIVVDGVPVRVTTQTDPHVGLQINAIRILDGGLLAVSASVGVQTFVGDTNLPPDAANGPGATMSAGPPLATLPFTAAQVAALVANPAMLP